MSEQLAYRLAKAVLSPSGFDHSIRVSKFVGNGPVAIVALLHDVVEDSEVSTRVLRVLFSAEVVDAVEVLTRRRDQEYRSYISEIKSSGNGLALAVKLADIWDHLNGVSAIPDALAGRYIRAYLQLGGQLS